VSVPLIRLAIDTPLDLNNFVTLSVMPGLEYVLPMTDNWSLTPFIDLGIARDFANETTAGIGGIGAKSVVTLDLDHSRLAIQSLSSCNFEIRIPIRLATRMAM
jgi:hypothetical protein